MTVYAPKENNTGAAVVFFPGGGYQGLAIDLEGTEVCGLADAQGDHVCAVEISRDGWGEYPKSGPYPESPMALEDAQRTMGLVRFHGYGMARRSAQDGSAWVFVRRAPVGSDKHTL
jgi:hypothetical protein